MNELIDTSQDLFELIEGYFAWTVWQGAPAELEAAYDLAVTYGHWSRAEQLKALLPKDREEFVRKLYKEPMGIYP